MRIGKILSKWDYPFIFIGCFVLLVIIGFPISEGLQMLLVVLLGFGGAYYLIEMLFLVFFRRIDFDWKLMNGHFSRRIICIVVLLPFFLTLVLDTTMRVGNRFGFDVVSSPKELIYEDNLYAVSDTLSDDIRKSQRSPSLLWIVYSHFMDPGNQHMSTSMAGRGWTALFAILGVILLNGILISIFTNWFDKRREHWLRGEIRYSKFFLKKGKFAVVIGANEIVSSVIKNLLSHKKEGEINFKCEGYNDYIILQTSKEAIDVREELSSHLDKEELRHVVIYNAKRDSKIELEKLYLENATEIYVLGESTSKEQGETYHDAMNMKCVNLIAGYLQDRNGGDGECGKNHKKVCKVMFEYQTTYSIFQYSDMPSKVTQCIVFIPFNCYETWAQRVMVEGVFDNREQSKAIACSGEIDPDYIEYTPLDGSGISRDSDEYVHFVVVGMSNMGVAMGVQAMFQAHYLNFGKARSRITFIDTNADKELAFFKGRYVNLFSLARNKYVDANNTESEMLDPANGWVDPAEQDGYQWAHLSKDGKNFIDLEIEFVKGELESDGVRDYLRRIAGDARSKLTIAVCLTHTHQAVAASLYMPVEIYKKVQEIWVYQREASDILTNLSRANLNDKRYKKLRPFGMMYGEYMRDRSLYLKSIMANGAYDKNEFKDIDMGDKEKYKNLRCSWKDLSIAKKWSNKFFVDSIYQKIRGIAPELFYGGNVAGAYKDKIFNKASSISNIEAVLGEAIEKNKEVLGQCEHNRWNVQQLLMEFSPCGKEDDEECIRLNSVLREVSLQKDKYDEKSLPVELESAYKKAKKDFKSKKGNLKESEDRIHPNICGYSHLDDVDFGAKPFDIDMNNAIPQIIINVDGYGKLKENTNK